MARVLDSLLASFRAAASQLPAARTGANQQDRIAAAAGCALATFFLQSPSFLAFQRQMEEADKRSNCQTLFGVESIPQDSTIRNLLDGLDPDLLDPLFLATLDTVRDQHALEPFLRLDGRLLVALDGIQVHCSDTVRCDLRSTRRVGARKTEQSCHTMLVADGHSRVLPLMPTCVLPRQDPAAGQPELSEKRRKQDCELNAASLRSYRPVFPGDDLYSSNPFCQLALDHGADFLFVCKPKSHKRLHEVQHEDCVRDSGWIPARNRRGQWGAAPLPLDAGAAGP